MSAITSGAAVNSSGPFVFSRRFVPKAGLCSNIAFSGIIYAVFFLLIGLPLLVVLLQAVLPDLFNPVARSWSLSLAPLTRAFGSTRVLESILHSVILGCVVAVTATALGAGYAVIMNRTDVPFRRFLSVVPWAVFLTPSYLKALAWVLLMSPGGYLPQLGILPPDVARSFFGLGGLVFVHTLNLFPLAYFVMAGALSGLGSEFEDAARIFGARPWKVWLRINGPLLAPAIALCCLALFAEVLSDFGLASTIARFSGFGLLTYGIYVAASDYPVDFALAGSQALLLLALVLTAVMADRLLRRQAVAKLISARSKPARIYDLGKWCIPVAFAAMIVLLLALVLPLSAIVARAFSSTLGMGLTPGNFTTEFVREALTLHEPANTALLRSLIYAGITALIASSIALVLAIGLDRTRPFTRSAVLFAALGSVAIPGIVLAFGYILVWNGLPGFRDFSLIHYGGASLLVMGYVAAALPYCLVIIISAVDQLAPGLVDAARLQGVGRMQRVLRIVLPLVALSALTAFLFTFLRTVFELPMSQMLIPQSGPPVPAMVTRLFAHDGDGLACALSLVCMVCVGIIALIVWSIARHFLWFGVKPDRSTTLVTPKGSAA